MKDNKFVSIIIPCRNEEDFIEDCLRSFLEQDYPKESMEILVIDGMSNDKTINIIDKLKEEKLIKIIENKKIYTPFALNLGIKNAKGDIIIFGGAHAKYKKDYVSKSVVALEKYNADSVGGVLKTIPQSDSVVAKAISLSLSSFFGAGNASFRTGVKEAREVDTVFGGSYRKDVFKEIGLFNEKLIRGQDMELNLRLKKNGGKIILSPDIVAYYYPKDKLFSFFLYNLKDGFWSIYSLKFMNSSLKLRHYIPLIFVLSIIISFLLTLLGVNIAFSIFQLILFLYLFSSFFFSFKVARREKFKYSSIIMIAFALRHFGYGLGSVWGVVRLAKEKLLTLYKR